MSNSVEELNKIANLVHILVKYEPRKLTLDNDCWMLEFDDISPISFGEYDRDDILRALCVLYDIQVEDV